MYILFLAWWGLLGAGLIYAGSRGAAPERLAIAALAINSIATYVATVDPQVSYREVETEVAAADLLLAAVLLWTALRANRRWPLACCGMQLVTVVGHAAKALTPQLSTFTYALMTGFWSWPILFLIVMGAYRHRRRLAERGVDPSWRTSSGR